MAGSASAGSVWHTSSHGLVTLFHRRKTEIWEEGIRNGGVVSGGGAGVCGDEDKEQRGPNE